MPNTARMQIALAAGAHFQSRIAAALTKIAWIVVNESSGTPNHAQRAAYAQRVLGNVGSYAAQVAAVIVERPNVLNFVTSWDWDISGPVTTAADADLESQITTDWDRLSGV